MKKIITAVATIAMVLSMGTVSAFAATESVPGSKEIDVKAKYTGSTTAPEVYSVDLSWGSMEFTYKADGKKTWNPTDHKYTTSITDSWVASGNDITVTNHSNTGITADFAFNAEEAYKTVTGNFDKSTISLATAEGTTSDKAPKGSVALNLGGTLKETVADFTTVGKVTVTLK